MPRCPTGARRVRVVRALLDTRLPLASDRPGSAGRRARHACGRANGPARVRGQRVRVAIKYAVRRLQLPEPPGRYVTSRMRAIGAMTRCCATTSSTCPSSETPDGGSTRRRPPRPSCADLGRPSLVRRPEIAGLRTFVNLCPKGHARCRPRSRLSLSCPPALQCSTVMAHQGRLAGCEWPSWPLHECRCRSGRCCPPC